MSAPPNPAPAHEWTGTLKCHGLEDQTITLSGEIAYIEHMVAKLAAFFGPLLISLVGKYTKGGS